MKTKTEIEMRKVRKQLQKYTISQEEKAMLREKLLTLKEIAKKEKTDS